MKAIIISIILSFPFLVVDIQAQQNGAGVTDIDGNSYKTVILQGKEWMAENLRVTRFSNGDSISDRYLFDASQAPLFIRPNELTPPSHDSIGIYYRTSAIKNAREICPIGWRLPTRFDIRSRTIGGDNNKGLYLKSESGWIQNGNGLDSANLGIYPFGFVVKNPNQTFSINEFAETAIFPLLNDNYSWEVDFMAKFGHDNDGWSQVPIENKYYNVRCIKRTSIQEDEIYGSILPDTLYATKGEDFILQYDPDTMATGVDAFVEFQIDNWYSRSQENGYTLISDYSPNNKYTSTFSNLIIKDIDYTDHNTKIRAFLTCGQTSTYTNFATVKVVGTLDTCYLTVNDTVNITVYDTVQVVTHDTIRLAVEDTLNIYFSVDINNSTFDVDLRVYPNPADLDLQIEVIGVSNLDDYELNITNSIGQEMYGQINIPKSTTIDISSWASGLYKLILRKPNGEILANRKIVIH